MIGVTPPDSAADEDGGRLLLAGAEGQAKVISQEREEPDYSSVITQVTKREPVVPPPVIQTFNLQHNSGGPLAPGSPAPHRAANDSVAAVSSGTGRPVVAPGAMGSSGDSTSFSPSSWRSKLRCLLCCFAPDGPQHGGYVKSKELMPGVGAAGMYASSNGALHYPQQVYMGMAGAGGGGRLMGLGAMPLMPMALRQRDSLIGPRRQEDVGKKTLVLDLDETLVHSSFKPIPSPDFIIPVEIDGKLVDVYVLKRPWLDHFMESVGHRYEVVIFTASLSKYADPLLDLLDKAKVVRWRLFRDACLAYGGNYVKDLACLGRELQDIIIVDNSPHSYVFQPANALPIGTFIDNMEDQELLDLLPVLQQTEFVQDVRAPLSEYHQALSSQMQLASMQGVQ